MYSIDLKEKVVKYYHKIKSIRKTANIFDISKSSVQRWINNISFEKKKYYRKNILNDKLENYSLILWISLRSVHYVHNYSYNYICE